MQKLGRHSLIALTLTYGVIFFLWRLLVWSPTGQAWAWLQVSEVFGMVVYLPALLLLPVVIALRSRWAWIGLLIPLIWFGAQYGNLFLPNAASPAQAGAIATFRVMTWNTGNSIGYWGNSTQELQDTAAKVQPDIILFQEVGSDVLLQLQALADGWPYQTAGLAGGRRQAIASKWPIISETPNAELEACQCRKVTIDWRGQPIDVVAVHVSIADMELGEWRGLPLIPKKFDTAVQSKTFDALLADYAHSDLPLILAGDFNTTERQPNYARMLQAGLTDVHEERGWGIGLTFPRPGYIRWWMLVPLIRIDHIFHDHKWVARRTWVGFLRPSDHLYLVADLQLRNAP